MLQLGVHPNIIALHYCVVSEGDEFLMFLTLVDGAKSLDDAITSNGAARTRGSVGAVRRRVEGVLVDVAAALDFCHAQRRAPPGREAGERAHRRRRFGQAHGLWPREQGRRRRWRASRQVSRVHARVRVARGARAPRSSARGELDREAFEAMKAARRLSPAEHDIYAFGAMAVRASLLVQ